MFLFAFGLMYAINILIIIIIIRIMFINSQFCHGFDSVFLYAYRSMYFDEDGDLAHEFYKPVWHGSHVTMERHSHNLKPQVIPGCLSDVSVMQSLSSYFLLLACVTYSLFHNYI